MAWITPYNRVMSIAIRPATPNDAGQMLAFIQALADYEREPHAVLATEADILRYGFGEHRYFRCLIAELNGAPAGFALYFYDYSTWLGRPGIFLEDLFVLSEFRRHGVGKALLQRLAAIALDEGCTRLKWEVLGWNQLAIDFYAACGAEFMDAWRTVRVTGEGLRRLADSTALADAADGSVSSPSFREQVERTAAQ